MPNFDEILSRLSNKHKKRVANATEAAERMAKVAEAAKEAAKTAKGETE